MISAPPSFPGDNQDTVSTRSPDVPELMAGVPGVVLGVPMALLDQDPPPTALTARTCESYSTPLFRLPRVYLRAPEVHTPSSFVQLASVLSEASLRM